MPSQKFQLRVVSGLDSEIVRVFDQNVVTIGRGADSDLRIENGIVSRQHAELLRSSKGFMLFAQSKTNPVSVDDAVVTPDQTAPLTDGSRFVLSNKLVIEFSLVSEGAAPSPAPSPAPRPEPSSSSTEATDQFDADLLKKVRSSLSNRAEAPGSKSHAREKPAPPAQAKRAPASGSLSRPTIPLSRAKPKSRAHSTLETPEVGQATELSDAKPERGAPKAQPPRTPSREQNPLLTKLFSKAPEVVEVVSGPRPREGKPGAAIQIEGLTGRTRVEVFDDLLIGAGPDSDVVIQGRAVEGQAALQDGDELEVYGVRLQIAIPAR